MFQGDADIASPGVSMESHCLGGIGPMRTALFKKFTTALWMEIVDETTFKKQYLDIEGTRLRGDEVHTRSSVLDACYRLIYQCYGPELLLVFEEKKYHFRLNN